MSGDEIKEKRPVKACAGVKWGCSWGLAAEVYGYSCLLMLFLFGIDVTLLFPELKCQGSKNFNSLMRTKGTGGWILASREAYWSSQTFWGSICCKVNIEIATIGFIWFCPSWSYGGAVSWVVPVQAPAKGLLLLPWPSLIPLWSLGKPGMPQWPLKKQGELGPEPAFHGRVQFRTQMLHSSCWKMGLISTWGIPRCCTSASGSITHPPSLRYVILLFKMWLLNLDHFTKSKSGSNCTS